MILVIDRRACTLRHDRGVLRIDADGSASRHVPISQLELLVVYGNPLAETAVWRALAKAGVPTVLLPARGQDPPTLIGPGLAVHLSLRRLQHRLGGEAQSALALARWLLEQKLRGYDLPLALLAQRHGADPERCACFGARRDRACAGLAEATSIDALMGIEGQVANAWFGLLTATLRPAWNFNGRTRRPPRDPVNALLSLGYTLVGTEIHRAVMAAGLDPSLGFLHQPAPARAAMVLDLTEVFRAGVDHFVLGYIAPDGPDQADYYYRDDSGCRLSKAGRPGFFSAWARRREAWPYPLGVPAAAEDWPTGGLAEQINGWIERLRAELKRVAGASEMADATTTPSAGSDPADEVNAQ